VPSLPWDWKDRQRGDSPASSPHTAENEAVCLRPEQLPSHLPNSVVTPSPTLHRCPRIVISTIPPAANPSQTSAARRMPARNPPIGANQRQTSRTRTAHHASNRPPTRDVPPAPQWNRACPAEKKILLDGLGESEGFDAELGPWLASSHRSSRRAWRTRAVEHVDVDRGAVRRSVVRYLRRARVGAYKYQPM